MFEREIKYINDISINKIQPLGNHISLARLRSAGVHPALVKYIVAEIDFLLFEDRQKLLRNSIFDYTGENIENYFLQINEEIKDTKTFSVEYISKLILHATSFTVNYLTRPNWTLMRFLFDNEKSKSTIELKQILNYLYYYDYFKEVIISYIDRKNLMKINMDELAELIGKIDLAGSETNRISIIETAAKSISEFFNIADSRKSRVSLPALEMFLEDKKYDEFASYLKNEPGFENKTTIEFAELQHFLNKAEGEQETKTTGGIEEKYSDGQTENLEEYSEELDGPVTIELKGTSQNQPPVIEIVETDPVENHTSEKSTELNGEDNEQKETETEVSEQGNIDLTEESTEPEVSEQAEIEELFDEENLNDDKTEPETESFEVVENEELKFDNKNSDIKKFEIVTDLKEYVTEPDKSDEIDDLFEELDEKNDLKDKVEENNINVSKLWLKVPIGEASSRQQHDVVKNDKVEENIPPLQDDLFEEIVEEPESEDAGEISEDDSFEDGFMKEDEVADIKNNDTASDIDNSESDDAWGMYAEPENIAETINDTEDDNTEELLPKEERFNNPQIDISELLEHKKMTRIIENIFDYDMEDFANVIEKISACGKREDAFSILDEVYRINKVKPKSKDAELFKEIISEYFDRN